MSTVSVEAYVGYVDVDVSLEDFDSEDLIDELQRRGREVITKEEGDIAYLRNIYELRRNGQDYQYELDQLIYNVLGRVS